MKQENIPRCQHCHNFYRPVVVWFGEQLDKQVLNQCINHLISTDILIVAGTSGVVYPVADFPSFAKRNNPDIQIFEFNLDRTPISSIATETIIGSVEETLVDFFS